jgi:sugar lactone lactonase YvrE
MFHLEHRRVEDLFVFRKARRRARKRTLFPEMGSDGMTIDTEGNVYLTGRGVTVFDKSGKNRKKMEVQALGRTMRLVEEGGPIKEIIA